jgi:hypothetical protein
MADQAFALSPINAHSASPTDADYDAISEAFMETARGRWFLGEFARRNRSADTAMVLDAVARIERSIAAQKAPPPDELSAALAAVKIVVADAKDAVTAALDDGALDHILAPHRKSARVIREIAWGLRESGADVRICDLLDGQVQAINAACDSFAAFPMREAALRAIDVALADIDRIAAGDIPGPAMDVPATRDLAVAETPEETDAAMELADATLPEPEAPPQEDPVAEAEPEQAVVTAQPPEAPEIPAAAMEMAPEAPLAVAEAAAEAAVALAAPDTASEPEAITEPEARTETGAMAEPEAVAAPAPEPAEPALAEVVPEAPADDLAEVVAPAPVEPEPELADALAHEIFAAPAAPEPTPRHQTVLAQVELMPVTAAGPVAELPGPADVSLGASLIASGIVPKPAAPKPDPLAPIRRMTQIEKIALFS